VKKYFNLITALVMMIFLYDKVIVGGQSSFAQKDQASVVTAFAVPVENTLTVTEKEVKPIEKPKVEVVEASYFGGEKNDDLHGELMGNGEVFNKYDATTVAVPKEKLNEWPFGSILEVTNVKNGKTIKVEVKTTGSFKEKYDRGIDLSEAAAKKLGYHEEGVTEVAIALVKKGNGKRHPDRA
jgi:rare lipoprotein A